MERFYTAAIFKEEGKAIGVSFPEVPGILTGGDTEDEALSNAREALALHLKGLLDDGDAVPEPKGLEWVRAHSDAEGATAFVQVPAPPLTPKTVRVNITMDAAELDLIDALAKEAGSNRSAFLVSAALRNGVKDREGKVNTLSSKNLARRRRKGAGIAVALGSKSG